MPFGDEKVTQFSGFPPTSVSYLKDLIRESRKVYVYTKDTLFVSQLYNQP